MEQYPTKDLTIDPQVAEEAIKRLFIIEGVVGV